MSYQNFLNYRERYPDFIYEGFSIEDSRQELKLIFRYLIKGTEESIPLTHTFSVENVSGRNADKALLENAAFHIGLIETINYWKAVCSPRLIIKPHNLTKKQLAFWEKLFFNGLGEFMYRNGIYEHIRRSDFIEIVCDPDAPSLPPPMTAALKGNLIPVGGGKDSIVTLELLKDRFDQNKVFLLDPRKAASDSSICAGYDLGKTVFCHRSFDPTLFELNKKGYLNGHIPYSAVLAFCALLAALLEEKKNIVLSNEGSANEPTVPDTVVNHQYSKTFEFEKDFSDYIHEAITPSVRYFSLLRPWSELRITQEFAKLTRYHGLFRSCNRGSKENLWCGACPKCLFVFILLSSCIGIGETSRIFGSNVLDNGELIPILDELTGISPVKPFECVGTVAETVHALDHLLETMDGAENAPALLKHFAEKREKIGDHPMVLEDPDAENLLPREFKKFLFGK